jgi:hypothetical protein
MKVPRSDPAHACRIGRWLGLRCTLKATSPSAASGVVVARVFGVRMPRRTDVEQTALGSSTQALKMPRGRWQLEAAATCTMPFASSAEASVSPGVP